MGRWGISYRRKRAIRGLTEPFDIEVADGVKARLYPSTNRCEKRALCGVQIWDAAERGALRDAIDPPSNEPFIFLDVGANSGANIDLIRTAISTQAGEMFLSDGGRNRGEGQLAESGEAVTAMTLLQLCQQHEVTQIDALKLDIEGLDFAVLSQFFDQAPTSLHPRLMILELDADSAAPLIELTQAHAYLILKRTHMNIVVRKQDQI